MSVASIRVWSTSSDPYSDGTDTATLLNQLFTEYHNRLNRACEEDGLNGLKERSRRKPNLRNRVPEKIEEALVNLVIEYPRSARFELQRDSTTRGVRLSPAGIRRVWAHHPLNTNKTPLNRFEEKVASEGCVS